MNTTVYCPDCDLFLVKEKTGVVVRLKTIRLNGDVFKCSGCGKIVYSDFGVPYEV